MAIDICYIFIHILIYNIFIYASFISIYSYSFLSFSV